MGPAAGGDEGLDGRPGRNAIFATHPAPEERLETLRGLAAERGGVAGRRGHERYLAQLAAIRPMLVQDVLGLRQYGRTEVALDGLLRDAPEDGLLWYAKGEVYRLRAEPDDAGRRALGRYLGLKPGASDRDAVRRMPDR